MADTKQSIVIPSRYDSIEIPQRKRRQRGFSPRKKVYAKPVFLSQEEFMESIGITRADVDAAEIWEIE